ncbi:MULTISPECIES: hypothetical protein [Myxococcus]|uniref:hypothetical protein n=1 Tax=Myxococcus TaxID=32 RepID=UPI0013CFC721|nr:MULTISPECIES: hypothetical protein [Myxococcus]NVJ26840.1 hypothetical protein [Myxococcus sp. AM011]
MTRLKDRTGGLIRVFGVGGLGLLLALAVTLREPPPPLPEAEPTPEPPVAPPSVARPMTARFQGAFPSYPQSTTIPMGRMEANGNPMEMAYFETTSPPGEVLEFYAREFRRRGHRTNHKADGPNAGAVSYYDARLGALVSVTAVGAGDKKDRTQVFPSIVETPEGVHLQARVPEALPRAPGATTVLRVDDLNPGPSEGSITVTEIAQGTPGTLAEFYRRELGQRGFTQVEARSARHGVEVLGFTRPGERLSLSLSPVQKDGLPETLATVVLEQATSPEGHP